MDEVIIWPFVSEIIKKSRLDKTLTITEVAQRAALSTGTISRLERGYPVTRITLSKVLNVLELDFSDIAFFEINSTSVAGMQEKVSKKENVFISYSHQNRKYLDRLLVHLKPLEKKEIIDTWVDTKLLAGDKWKIEIEKALKNARAAILLISADFLASDFIINNELPPLLKKAHQDGTIIIPVILSPCRFIRDIHLSEFQAINSPDEPLGLLDEMEQELIYDAVSQRIEELFK